MDKYYIFYLLMEEEWVEDALEERLLPTGIGVTSEAEAIGWVEQANSKRSFMQIKVYQEIPKNDS